MVKPFKVAVIGGGISGLSAAVYLEKEASERGIEIEVTLIEKSPRLGGVIRSERVDGFLFESGPEGWASYKPAARQLVRDFDLESEIIGSMDKNRRTFVVRDGRLAALPDGMTFFAPVEPLAFWRTAPLSVRGKLRAGLEPFIRPSRGDISVRIFFERRLGREFTDELVEPLISAILGGDFEKLSIQCVLQELYRVEQRTGSLWKGLRRFAKMTLTTSVLHTMSRGMSELPNRLHRRLSDARIFLNIPEVSLFSARGGFRLQAGEFEDRVDRVVFCTPAPAAAEILKTGFSDLSALLEEIPYTSSTLVYLAYKRSEFNHPLDGFGFIVPRREAHAFDACTWINRKFDGRTPEDRVLIRAATHNARRARRFESDEALADAVEKELGRIMNLNCLPVFRRIYRVRDQIPQLFVGHVERKRKIGILLEKYPGLHLAGSYWGGVGIPDCIRTGRDTAQAIIDSISGSQRGS